MNNKTEFDKKIDDMNKKILHYVWTIFISMMTSILVVLAFTGKIP